jgi:hypothetical protein
MANSVNPCLLTVGNKFQCVHTVLAHIMDTENPYKRDREEALGFTDLSESTEGIFRDLASRGYTLCYSLMHKGVLRI